MLAFQKADAGHGLRRADVPAPVVTAGDDVLIAVEAVGICGSDVHAFEWTDGYQFLTAHFPRTLGHEASGRIIRVGKDVVGLVPGDRVVIAPVVVCGHCSACRTGQPQFCTNRSIVGFHRDGAFAERVVVPAANCFRLPDGVDAELGALIEPLCVAGNAVDVGAVGWGDRVIVMGAGPIGVGIAWLAKRAGATSVLLVGKDDETRLGAARSLGIERTLDLALAAPDMATTLLGGAADVVFEATGVPETIETGLGWLRPGGTLVATGIHARPVQFDLTRFVRSKQQLRAAYDSSPATFARMLSILAEDGEALRGMITHRLPLSATLEGFEIAASRQALKVMLLANSDATAAP
ncbi:alcohol dehydrogenase catalytic domain-containing protein [Kaistia dalseonensis]|uniref:L-iditol 2-dehydrogenase n=1 Tax=Kaistia dalseonensis TaxID=410840 RepID=A0ABU0H3Y7_9HYPH|nr:alcohol dehydrogenase catalytic domain-containing protein [Kaistia dalseonensis]MCX5494439.1 alcohol dehydrogenase catalytic domain-containing protein [Kaistia dalseonensis]MDQ0437018.1 L-iditol 2-dehydrogenase [Kaistia dalseonensis]